MKQELSKVNYRINITQYTFQEYAEYFNTFHGRKLLIKTENEDILLKMDNNNLPHLIGLHYAYDKLEHQKKYKGKKGFELLLNNEITIAEFRNRVKKNNKHFATKKSISWDMILDRIEWLPFFFNSITKKTRLRENKANRLVNSSLNGNYFYFKVEENLYLILSCKKINKNFILESFIVYDNIRYLGDLDELNIIDVYWKDE